MLTRHVFAIDLDENSSGVIKVGPQLSKSPTLTTQLSTAHMWKVVSARVVYHPFGGSGAKGVLIWDFDTSLTRTEPNTLKTIPLGKSGSLRMARGLTRGKNLIGTGSEYVWMPYKIYNASSGICGRALVHLTVLTVDPK